MVVRDIYEFMNKLAPFSTAEEWDNSGLILGSYSAECRKIMLALDITADVVRQAINAKVDLIVTHHPPIFSPIKTINFDSPIAKLVAAGISVISSHTCFDIANGGMNDILCEKVGLANVRSVTCDDGFSFRIGTVSAPTTVGEFSGCVADALKSSCVCSSLKDKKVKTVAVCSGAGSSVVSTVIALGVDAFLTGEIKYNSVLELYDANVAVISAGHFETECIFKEVLSEKMAKEFKTVSVILADEPRYLMGV